MNRNRWQGVLARAAGLVALWHQSARSRRQLAEMDEYMLRDIGLSRSQAQFESSKSSLRDLTRCVTALAVVISTAWAHRWS